MSLVSVCPTCDGGRVDPIVWDDRKCPDCVGGRVVSESVIEEMEREALREFVRVTEWETEDETFDLLVAFGVKGAVNAALRVVLEHMEDNE